MEQTSQPKHYRFYIDLPKDILVDEVNKLSREELIDWLSWNDPNGVYNDEDSMDEFGNVMSLEEGREIMVRQISEGQGFYL
ncbi:hypothetical protein KIH41_16890 [Litoribacter ruber]|uniref:hypothetical protein n=1 Tax=Litoribacter ruber TaxID=702568 RepID=UPI001BDA174B|nr:hypothetical protein [Litoribacter ruber]MBT0812966.1 hypothetical protein [Litoribacter ruber]